MRKEVKIIAKYRPSVAATLEEEIVFLENEVVDSDTDPLTLDWRIEISKKEEE